MKIITWNRSFKGMQNGDDAKDDFENDEWETLATVVDKILAWEKKLYDEVKVHLIPLFFLLAGLRTFTFSTGSTEVQL